MSDIDFAFNNYCIACDKLCPTNSIYCSETCKSVDEQQSSSIIDQSQHHQHHQHEYDSYSSDNEDRDHTFDIVSPLMTPSLYHHQYSANYAGDVNASPLMLSAKQHDHSDVNYFDLNYSVSQYTSSSSSNIADHLPSTSHNYRKWLTACL